MLQSIEGLPDDVVGVEASGKVTGEDYQRVLEPALERGLEHNRKVRFLYYLGPQFSGLNAGAFWEDAKVGLRHMTDFEKCAVVTDVGWIRDAVRLFRVLIPCPVQVFKNVELEQGKAWVLA